MKAVLIYTDGSCLKNPGPGGYGVILNYKGFTKELSQGYRETTNNRMEMMAVIAALSALTEPCSVLITTDSRYVKDGVTQWLRKWKQNGWITSAGGEVKNADLWRTIDTLCSRHKVAWAWVKGHAEHVENERCDVLARGAASQAKSKLCEKDDQPYLFGS